MSIDDFGSGFTSLSHLRRLSVDELKLDKSFARGLRQCHEEDAAIVRSILGLAQSLGLDVVAEGVEDGETWEALARLGCPTAQGYFLGRPIAADALAAWVRAASWDQDPPYATAS